MYIMQFCSHANIRKALSVINIEKFSLGISRQKANQTLHLCSGLNFLGILPRLSTVLTQSNLENELKQRKTHLLSFLQP